MWQAGVACLALLVLPAVAKDLADIKEEELAQAQEPDLSNYDDYKLFREHENALTTSRPTPPPSRGVADQLATPIKGVTGEQGVDGPPGSPGVPGVNGVPGSSGIPGPVEPVPYIVAYAAQFAAAARGDKGPVLDPYNYTQASVGSPGIRGIPALTTSRPTTPPPRGVADQLATTIKGVTGKPGDEGPPGAPGVPRVNGVPGSSGIPGPVEPVPYIVAYAAQFAAAARGDKGPVLDPYNYTQASVGSPGIRGIPALTTSRPTTPPPRGVADQLATTIKGVTGKPGDEGPPGAPGVPRVNGVPGSSGIPGPVEPVPYIVAYAAQFIAAARGDKGPVVDPYNHTQASVGSPGIRGIPALTTSRPTPPPPRGVADQLATPIKGVTGEPGVDGPPGSPGVPGVNGVPGSSGIPEPVKPVPYIVAYAARLAAAARGDKGPVLDPYNHTQASVGSPGIRGIPAVTTSRPTPPPPRGVADQLATPIKGVTGEQGVDGPPGSPGVPGVNGVPGSSGIPGPVEPVPYIVAYAAQLAAAARGDKGPVLDPYNYMQASVGSPGIRGIPALTTSRPTPPPPRGVADQLATPIKGVTGEPGVDGPPGSPGVPGVNGVPGSSGIPGPVEPVPYIVAYAAQLAAAARGDKGPVLDPYNHTQASSGSPGIRGIPALTTSRPTPPPPRGVADQLATPIKGVTGEPGVDGPPGSPVVPRVNGVPGSSGIPGPVEPVPYIVAYAAQLAAAARGDKGPVLDPYNHTQASVGSPGIRGIPALTTSRPTPPPPRGVADQLATPIKGVTGEQGVDGPPGSPGVPGVNGVPGSSGIPGPVEPVPYIVAYAAQLAAAARGDKGPVLDPYNHTQASSGSPGIRGIPALTTSRPTPPTPRGVADQLATPIKGVTGEPGVDGPPGSPGVPGVNGVPGSSGIPEPIEHVPYIVASAAQFAAAARGDKGPVFDPYNYTQASVGSPGIRGIPALTTSRPTPPPTRGVADQLATPIKGVTGEPGVDGPPGSPGVPGVNGVPGSSGIPGPVKPVPYIVAYGAQFAAAARGEKGPVFDPYNYTQASVGSAEIRGIPAVTTSRPTPPPPRGVADQLATPIKGVTGEQGVDGPPGSPGVPRVNGVPGSSGVPEPVEHVPYIVTYGAQLAAAAAGDKGPVLDPYNYTKASVGSPGIRGIPALTTSRPTPPLPQGVADQLATPIKGVTGEQGVDGPPGSPGVPGVNGVPGSSGIPGPVEPVPYIVAYAAQLSAAARGDKGPVLDPYNYMQASVGSPGIRGIPALTTTPRGVADQLATPIKGVTGEPGVDGPPGSPGVPRVNGVPGSSGIPEPVEPVPYIVAYAARLAAAARGDKGPVLDPYNYMQASVGSPGSRGITGRQGEQGPQGSVGLTGPPEEPAERGEPGTPGIPGEPGAPGSTGERGQPGPQGTPDLSGLPGPTGMPGLKGDRGDAGAKGQQGAPGNPGPPGPIGPPGEGLACDAAEIAAMLQQGQYWIDPNGGDINDAIMVYLFLRLLVIY